MIGRSLAIHSELDTAINWEQTRRLWFLKNGDEANAKECEARIDDYWQRLQDGAG